LSLDQALRTACMLFATMSLIAVRSFLQRNPMLRIASAGALFFAAASGRAEILMPRIFDNHMVLQANAKLPVWGWAAPGKPVKVEFKGKTKAIVAAADGTWISIPLL
jgi:hypothetical protein